MDNSFVDKYYVERRNTNCIKWDVQAAHGEIPMAIADMDFKGDERITESLVKKMAHGAYGYTVIPDDYYQAMIAFNKRRHNVDIEEGWIRFSTGAVDGLYQIVNSMSEENDSILVMSPAYMPFYHCVEDTNRRLIVSNLVNTNGKFEMDFHDIENKFKNEKVKMSILCSPHNPTARVWNKNELDRYFELAHKYHVITISDEVHADFVSSNHNFISALGYKQYYQELVVINSVSKTFNLAMFSHSHIIIPDDDLRNRIDKYRKYYHREVKGGFNAFASYYGYLYGEKWLDDVNKVIYSNYELLKNELSCLEIAPLEGTYLAFINLGEHCNGENGAQLLKEKCNIIANDGEAFGQGYGNWVRLNLATKPEIVAQACKAIKEIID